MLDAVEEFGEHRGEEIGKTGGIEGQRAPAQSIIITESWLLVLLERVQQCKCVRVRVSLRPSNELTAQDPGCLLL